MRVQQFLKFSQASRVCKQKLKFLFSDSSAKITLLRHAKSEHNWDCDYHGKNLDIDWTRPLQNDQFCKKGPYNIERMDSSLSSDGEKQCQQARQKLINKNFDLILVSPMLRTLQTCQLVFGSRGIPIKVQPLIAQPYRYSCDLIPEGKTQQKHIMFKQFDFSEDYSPQFFYHCSKDKLNFIKKHFEWKSISSELQKYQEINKLIRYHMLIESDCELKNRVNQFKQKLIKKIQIQGIKNICLVSHFYFINFLLAKSFGPKGTIQQIKDIQNCQPIETNLQQIMKTV